MDTIYINGDINTMNKNNKKAEAFGIKDGKFYKVGSNEEVLDLKTGDTEIIDLEGKTVVPGINDSHFHLLNYAYSLEKVDLSECTSIEEIISKSRQFIKDNDIKEGDWLLGRGWNDVILSDKREPVASDLDKISSKHPICITRICEHTIVANTKALEIANITVNTQIDGGGSIDKDTYGEINGILRESARYLIYDIIPDKSVEEIKEMLSKAFSNLVEYGITSVQSDDFEALPSKDYEKVIEAYRQLEEENRLSVRVYEQCLLPNKDRLEEFIEKGYNTGVGNDFFKIGPLKLLTDGSLGQKTAYLKDDYSDDPGNKGISVFTQEELDTLVETAHKNDMQVILHAIGDEAMNMGFRSFERALENYPKEDPRFSMIHIQITNEEIIKKFKEMKVIANMEPICMNNDLHMAESRVGERIKHAYAYNTLAQNGPYCLSSDSPVDSMNPMKSIYVAVNRKDYKGYPENGWMIDESMTVEDCVYGFTMGSAYQSYEEDIKGSIEEDKYADFVILSDDIFNIDSMDIINTKIERTVMNGKTTYLR